MLGLRKKGKPMDAIEIKDFSALTGYTNAILAIDEWLEHKPDFYVIKDQYLIDEAIRVEYIIIQ